MSKLENLIVEHCPNGVEYKALGDVSEIRSGWGFPNIEQGKLSGDYPFYKVGDMNLAGNKFSMNIATNYVDIDISNKLGCKPAPAGTIIFPKIGAAISTNKKRLLTKPSCYDNNVVGIIPSDIILSRYLFYQIEAVDLMNFADYSGAMPSIRKSSLEKFLIPVPPLPVQHEIVRILDNFSELTAELTANLITELTERKKQYEYYRSQLLTFGNDVPRKRLGEIVDVCMCKRIKKEQTEVNGDIPFYKNGTLGKKANAYISKQLFDEYSTKYPFPHVGDVMLSTAGTIGKAIKYDGLPAYFQDSNVVWLKNDGISVSNEYLYWFCMSMPWKLPTRGTIKHLHNDMILETEITIPSFETQQHIIEILNKFHCLYNDISIGLPAEIDARKKQYEYYRDKLLTFKELKA